MALITVDDLGDYLGQNLSSSDKATFVVASADQIVKTLTGQHLEAVSNDIVLMDGTGTDTILLPQLPVTNVDSVIEDDELLTELEDYVLGANGKLRRLPTVTENGWSTSTVRRRWNPGVRNIEVQYDHGYATLPADLKMVALLIASRAFNESAGNVISETLGQYSVRYSDTGGSDLTFTEKTIISNYRVAKQGAVAVAAS